MAVQEERTIAIIGAGFSGSMLALNLLQRTSACTRVLLIERTGAFGQGPAYATANPSHLLNVPAGRMGAYSAQPAHFAEWLGAPAEAAPGGFVPRESFGRYLRALLTEGQMSTFGRLRLVRGEAAGLSQDGGLTLHLADGRHFSADIAVLAIGNHAPAAILPDSPLCRSVLYRPDPWSPGATAGLDPEAPVLLIGTGLTMADTVMALLDAGHRGPITALSRRGMLPHRHSEAPAASLPLPSYPVGLDALLRCLRDDAARCVAAGGTWQQAMDRFRPFIQPAWLAASAAERSRFLRHLRPWWDIHRHRLPPAVADRIAAARASGQLRIIAGRIVAAAERQDMLEIEYVPRKAAGVRTIRAARVINGSGPDCDYTRLSAPLIAGMLRAGHIRPDPLRLGLEVSPGCALVGRDGAVSRTLFAVGPVTRGAFWEVTAVPDIRGQCEALAGQIAGLLQSTPAIGPILAPAGYSSTGPIDFMRSNTRLRIAGSVMR